MWNLALLTHLQQTTDASVSPPAIPRLAKRNSSLIVRWCASHVSSQASQNIKLQATITEDKHESAVRAARHSAQFTASDARKVRVCPSTHTCDLSQRSSLMSVASAVSGASIASGVRADLVRPRRFHHHCVIPHHRTRSARLGG